MSFVPLVTFLPDAFARLDRTQELSRRRSTKTLQGVFVTLLEGYNGYEVDYHDGVVTIYSSSSVLKHYVHQHQQRILVTLREALPQGDVRGVMFKGPRR